MKLYGRLYPYQQRIFFNPLPDSKCDECADKLRKIKRSLHFLVGSDGEILTGGEYRERVVLFHIIMAYGRLTIDGYQMPKQFGYGLNELLVRTFKNNVPMMVRVLRQIMNPSIKITHTVDRFYSKRYSKTISTLRLGSRKFIRHIYNFKEIG